LSSGILCERVEAILQRNREPLPRFTNPRLFALVGQKTSSPISRLRRYLQSHPFHLHLSCRLCTTPPLGRRELPVSGLTFHLVPCQCPFHSQRGQYMGGVANPWSGVRESLSDPRPRLRLRWISMSFTTNQGLGRPPPWTHQALTSSLESGKDGS
jgi:hypothetical protein